MIRRLALSVLGGALVIVGCGKTPEPAQSAAPRRPPAVAVRVARVETAAAPGSTAPGVVAARESAEITARAAASVRSVLVREGDAVQAGQLLLVLDDRDARARLEAAEAAGRSAAAERERIAGLLARDAATPREKEQADAAAAAAESAVAETRAALAYLRIASPFAGRVTAAPVREGELVVPGQRLLALEADGGYELRATVEADAARRLRPGDSLAVRVDGIPERLAARVKALSPAADPLTHRFLLRADLPEDGRLRSGLFARAELLASESAGRRLTVPQEALVERGGLTGVFVVEQGRARLRWIAIGAETLESVEVRAGLHAGETVVLAPASLQDGALVEPEG
ncbi:MAG: efflux RND transporter periplasmic adaptor subunit [Thermoanaerobaculia bacterium]